MLHFEDKRVEKIQTISDMTAILESKGNSLQLFKKGTIVVVSNKMEEDYSYTLQENPGKNLKFEPALTPQQMLSLGVFEGKYLNDCVLEFPKEWFLEALKKGKLSPEGANPSLNHFKIKSRMNLEDWQKSGWVPGAKVAKLAKKYEILNDRSKNHDVRGWFQWYCRYWMGRREPVVDEIQINRWRAFRRHEGQIKANCKPGDLSSRPRQRQALTQWAYDGTI